MTGLYPTSCFRLFARIFLFSLWACIFAQAQIVYPEQEIQVHNLPSLMARSHDPTAVLLTSLDTVFHDREICCGRGSALEDSAQAADPRFLKDVAEKLAGRHLLGDGRPIRVTAEYLTPEAVSAGHLVTMIANQHAALMQWNAHLYVVYGVVFVRTEDPSIGETAMVVRRLLLWDTRYSDSRRNVVFDRATQDAGRVQGLLFLDSLMEE